MATLFSAIGNCYNLLFAYWLVEYETQYRNGYCKQNVDVEHEMYSFDITFANNYSI